MLKFARILGVGVVIVLMSIVVLMFLAPRFGWRVDTVLSGSMEPSLRSGGIVVTRPVTLSDIRSGDVITFRSPLTVNSSATVSSR
jgi:signal peptidase